MHVDFVCCRLQCPSLGHSLLLCGACGHSRTCCKGRKGRLERTSISGLLHPLKVGLYCPILASPSPRNHARPKNRAEEGPSFYNGTRSRCFTLVIALRTAWYICGGPRRLRKRQQKRLGKKEVPFLASSMRLSMLHFIYAISKQFSWNHSGPTKVI